MSLSYDCLKNKRIHQKMSYTRRYKFIFGIGIDVHWAFVAFFLLLGLPILHFLISFFHSLYGFNSDRINDASNNKAQKTKSKKKSR